MASLQKIRDLPSAVLIYNSPDPKKKRPQMDTMELSVIIVSYNTAGLLARCLTTLDAALERAADAAGMARTQYAEVFVVDNASADGSAAAVHEGYPWVRVIANRQNRGFAAANNQALTQAAGRKLLLLNPDTEVIGDAIADLAAYLDQHPEAGVAGGRLRYGDGAFQHSAFRFPTLAMALLDFFPINHRLTESWINGRYSAALYHGDAFPVDHPLGACMMLRREVAEAIGGFAEDYFMYGEEVDWCLRIRQAGWDIACLPGAEFVHHGGRSTQQVRERMYKQLHHSRLTLFRKHYPLWYRAAVRPIMAAGLLAETARAWRLRSQGGLSESDFRARLRAYAAVAREAFTAPL
ncbi:MAG: glycosyltransferase family 2 protein [Chloroflexi bacterium]|nr:glycosyltransferase family 2 protein [Chloroflexota bacterium]